MTFRGCHVIVLTILLCISYRATAQYSLTGGAQTINFTSFTGSGLTPAAATAGSLDSDQWGIDLNNDGAMDADFGVSNTGAPYNGGTVADDGTAGNVHAYNTGSPTGMGIGLVQNNSGDPDVFHSAILRIVNNTGGIITDLLVTYDVYYVGNANPRDYTLAFEHSSDNSTYLDPGTLDFTVNDGPNGWAAGISPSATVSGLSIGAGETYFLKWIFQDIVNGGDNGMAITEIELTPTVANPASTSTITVGSASAATIASTVTSSPGQDVFDFVLLDDGASPSSDAFGTALSNLIITEGASDQIADWSNVIAGAQLSDGTNTLTTTNIGTNTITFNSIPTGALGEVLDNASKTYTLSVWFNTSISESIDNQRLQFEALASNFTFFGASSGLLSTEEETSSATDNLIDVDATQWSFANTPNSVGTGLGFSLDVQATDVNGNVDTDETTSFNLSVNSGPGNVSSGSGLTNISTTSGSFSYADLAFDTDGSYTLSVVTNTGTALTTATSTTIVSAQAYRSNGTGGGNWSSTATWEVFISPSWTTASVTPDNLDGPITIQSSDAVTLDVATTIDQLTIESSATLTLNSPLTLSDQSGENDIVVEGTMDVTNTASDWATAGGTVEVASGGLVTTGQQGEVSDLGGDASSGVFVYLDGSTFEYTGTNLPELVYFPDVTTAIPTFRITANQNTLNNMESLVMNGIFEANNNVTFSNSNGITFRNGFAGTGNVDVNSTTDITGTTVYLGGSGEVDLGGNDITFASGTTVIMTSTKNMEDGSFTFSSGSVFQTTDYAIDDIGGAAFDVTFNAGATIQALGANGLSDGTDGIINVDAQTINDGVLYEFNGTAAQNTNFTSIGVSTIGGLTINNSNGVTLSESITMSGGTLTLTSGNLITSTTFTPTLSSSTSISGGSTSSFIDGPVTLSNFTASTILPIGDGSDFRRVILDPVNSSTMTVENTTGTPPNNTSLSGLSDLFDARYWTISRSSGTGDVSLTLYIDESADGFTVDSDVVVASNNTGVPQWEQKGTVSAFTSSSITATVSDFSFTDFTLGALTGTLPVELISFSASTEGQEVILSWATASELNNDRFEIEQSVNAVDYRKIGELEGAGTTNEEQSYSFVHFSPAVGVNYYRLKQVDFDGSFEYSPVVRVNTDPYTSMLQLLQNPATDQTIRFIYAANANPVIGVFDLSGAEQANVQIKANSNLYELDISSLSHGVYLLQVDDQMERFLVE